MKTIHSIILNALIIFLACNNTSSFNTPTLVRKTHVDLKNKLAQEATIKKRFLCPTNYNRSKLDSNSYAFYLRNFELMPDSHEVHYYNGLIKSNKVHAAVLRIDVGKRDLQQCADAVMRLRAEYLFEQKRFAEISFRFLGDGKMHSFLSYKNGKKDYTTFRRYMDYVFSYANTASLKAQLKSRTIKDAKIGDVFIQSGNPYGHAISIVDICSDSAGNKLALLAQSYMPAQEIHILKNFNNKGHSPWYPLKDGIIETPEWTFNSTDLKYF